MTDARARSISMTLVVAPPPFLCQEKKKKKRGGDQNGKHYTKKSRNIRFAIEYTYTHIYMHTYMTPSLFPAAAAKHTYAITVECVPSRPDITAVEGWLPEAE